MNLIRRSLMVVVIATVIAGCASGPKYAEMKDKIPALKAGEGRVYVYRDSLLGAALTPSVYLNGKEVGISRANGFFYIDQPVGEYKLSASTEVERSVSFALAAGETKFVKVSISLGLIAGRPNFELVNAVGGQTAIEGLAYTGDK
jgi:hypothetical protein